MQITHSRIEPIIGLATVKPVFVELSYVGLIWPHVEGIIDKAMKHSGLDGIDGPREAVLAGNALLWITWNGSKIEAALVTKIVKPHDTKICILVACGGKGNWPVLIETIEDYARSEGCAITRIYGRKGWERVLSGYKATRVILDKEI